MSAHRHPKWLEEARRAEGGGVSEDDKMRSQHLNQMNSQATQQGMGNQGLGSGALEQAMKPSSHYEDMIKRANESGADPADVQDVLQGAMHRGD